MQSPQRQGEPAGRHHLKVGDMGEAKRAEGVERAGHGGGGTAVGQVANQEVHAQAGDGERQPEGDVVGEHGIAGDPIHRRDEPRDAEQILGKRQRRTVGKVNGRVPQPLKPVAEAIGIPPDSPGVKQRVDEIGGQAFRTDARRAEASARRWRRETRRRRRSTPETGAGWEGSRSTARMIFAATLRRAVNERLDRWPSNSVMTVCQRCNLHEKVRRMCKIRQGTAQRGQPIWRA